MRQIFVSMILLLGLSSLFKLGNASSAEVGPKMVKVDLKQGSIETPRTDLKHGKHFYVFKGIPYAQPPIGKLRFKSPEPPGPWSDVRDGSMSGPMCPQMDMMLLFSGIVAFTGNEDCLFLDVYTPKVHASAGLPVMVFIHGGGFTSGSAADYNAEYFMAKDVVIVAIQYRLGIFGFLSTEDDVMPGNYGLKDQVMALRWVQENIESFGGDPNKVTIFGESAGGMSVHFLMVSPMSEGLFHRAIAQSGTALFPGIIRDDHRDRAMAISMTLGCSGGNPSAFDSQTFYDCIKDISQDDVIAMGSMFARYGLNPDVMVPSVDGEFFPEHPTKLIQNGKYHKVDFLTGVTKNEGSIVVRPLLPDKNMMHSLAENFATNGPLQLLLNPDEESDVYTAKRVFYHYVGTVNMTEDKADEMEKMFHDFWYSVPLDLTGMMHGRDADFGYKTYLYELHHLGEHSFLDSPYITFGKHWVGHGDDFWYFFSNPFFGSLNRLVDQFMSDMMIDMWVNFAETGNPTPDMSLGFKWDPLSGSEASQLRYLILQPSPYMRGYTREMEMEFWKNLPTKQNKLLFPESFKEEL